MLAMISNKPRSTLPSGNLINRRHVAFYSIRATEVLNITCYSGKPIWGARKHLGSFSENTDSQGPDSKTLFQ